MQQFGQEILLITFLELDCVYRMIVLWKLPRQYTKICVDYIPYIYFFPNILKNGQFTIMLKDNIDINAKSTFVKSHYRGTSLSMVQFRNGDDVGTDFPEINFQTQIKEQSKKLVPLPTKHINVSTDVTSDISFPRILLKGYFGLHYVQ